MKFLPIRFLTVVLTLSASSLAQSEATLRGDARTAGHAVGSAIHDVGQGTKKLGKEIWHGTKEAGKTVGSAAAEGGRAFKQAVKGEK